MSRVIKFRGLNSEGEFVYGLPSSDAPNSTAYYNEYSQRICWLPEKGGCANQPIKNGTLCQFTGLHDKNGVEIYEGDVVKLNDCFVAEVKFYGCGFSVLTKSIYANRQYDLTPVDAFESVEVVGNIYQHPELLK